MLGLNCFRIYGGGLNPPPGYLMSRKPRLVRVKKNLFNNSLSTGRAYLNVFRGSTIKRINHNVTPTLAQDKPDVIVIHVGCNDITKQNMNIVNPSKLADGIINKGKSCASYSVKDIILPSILTKRCIKLTKTGQEN